MHEFECLAISHKNPLCKQYIARGAVGPLMLHTAAYFPIFLDCGPVVMLHLLSPPVTKCSSAHFSQVFFLEPITLLSNLRGKITRAINKEVSKDSYDK